MATPDRAEQPGSAWRLVGMRRREAVRGRQVRDTLYTAGMNTCDVAVVGAGSVGAAAALALARAGRDVVLVDPHPAGAGGNGSLPASVLPADPDDWDSRVFALSPASQALLSSLGVWQRLPVARLAPVHDMRLYLWTG